MGEIFVLVEFLKTNDVAVIPSSWLVSKDKALWPPYLSSTRINNAVRNRDSPCTEWTKYSVKIMYESGTVYIHFLFHKGFAIFYSEIAKNRSSYSNWNYIIPVMYFIFCYSY